MLQAFAGKPLRAFIVWEPVLESDWAAPSTETLGRIPDARAIQFWDKGRVISHSMGEHDRKSIVWDDISIYAPGGLWTDRPPDPVFRSRPVVKVSAAARAALGRL
jgi:hypothetical protein